SAPPSAVANPNFAAPSPPGNQPGLGPQPRPVDQGELSKALRIVNSAELVVEILPGAEIPVGTKVSFRISSKKPGYLLLIDVDATGKLTQIYPNPMSVVSARGGREKSNQVRPGKPIVIPNPSDTYAGYEFVASPPRGIATIVALLSARPVQIIDLPDVPS